MRPLFQSNFEYESKRKVCKHTYGYFEYPYEGSKIMKSLEEFIEELDYMKEFISKNDIKVFSFCPDCGVQLDTQQIIDYKEKYFK